MAIDMFAMLSCNFLHEEPGLGIYDYLPDYFKKKHYAACYNNVIYAASGQCLWERTEYGDLQPSPIRRQLGIQKKKRNKEGGKLKKDHSQLRRARYGIKCCRCNQSEHNKSTCKLPPPLLPPPAKGSSNPANSSSSQTHRAQIHTATSTKSECNNATTTSKSDPTSSKSTNAKVV
jgi:hypothetical protein